VRRRTPGGAAAALLIAGVAAVTASGCPARNLEVQITSDGADTLVVACESFRDACEPTLSCHRNHLLCNQETCELRDACTVHGGALQWTPEQAMGMRVFLFEFDDSSGTVTIKSASSCVPINLRPCIWDKSGTVGCPCIQGPLGPEICTDPGSGPTLSCIRDTLAEGVQAAMGGGMGFSGFTDLSNVALVAGFFYMDGAAPCDAGVTVGPGDCAPANLIAVAGLAAPVGSTTYDITCASCQGSTRSSFGADNAPCPATMDACFLQRVSSALDAYGM
jgi:hypothetical protein